MGYPTAVRIRPRSGLSASADQWRGRNQRGASVEVRPSWVTSFRSSDCGEDPPARGGAVESEQQHALPGAETELPVSKRDLLRAGADQEPDEPLAVVQLMRHEPRE